MTYIAAALESRITALVVDAAADAVLLRQARARQRTPHSPDPRDSVAPPSYEDVEPPPKYEDIVSSEQPGATIVNTPDVDSAAVDRSVVDTPAVSLAIDYTESIEGPVVADNAGPDHGRDTDMLVV